MQEQLTLIQECIRQNRTAQKNLYKRYAAKMLGVCCRFANSREDAEDILQDAFVRIFQNIDKFRFEGSFDGWIKKIVINTAIIHIRRHQHLKYEVNIEEAENVFDLSHIVSTLNSQVIMEQIRKLPAGYRSIINLYAIEGYSHHEIAEMMGIDEGTSRSQFLRGKASLLKRLKRISDYELASQSSIGKALGY